MKNIKPNGEPMGTFIISINDGFVEYSYKLPIRNKKAFINSIWQRLRKQYRIKDQKPFRGHRIIKSTEEQ
jgi:hypothetical protein